MALSNPFKLPSVASILGPNTGLARTTSGIDIDSYKMAQTLEQLSKYRESQNNSLKSENYRNKMIAMRLRVPEGNTMPYQDLFTSLAGDKVFVFVVQDNQAVTLEDDAALFPSDTLITQLRLLDK